MTENEGIYSIFHNFKINCKEKEIYFIANVYYECSDYKNSFKENNVKCRATIGYNNILYLDISDMGNGNYFSQFNDNFQNIIVVENKDKNELIIRVEGTGEIENKMKGKYTVSLRNIEYITFDDYQKD